MLENAVEEELGVSVLDRGEHQFIAGMRVVQVLGAKVIEPVGSEQQSAWLSCQSSRIGLNIVHECRTCARIPRSPRPSAR